MAGLASAAVSYTHLDVYKRQALYRDVLFERVWGGEMDDGTRTLDLHIQRLRKKLGWHCLLYTSS